MPVVSSTLPNTIDSSLQHLDCLAKLGWLSFDVTHMGDPDGYMMTPCCIHGYRAVYGPRPKNDWIPFDPNQERGGVVVDTPGFGDRPEGFGGAFYTEQFILQQVQGGEGSWVLVTGATQTGDEPPTDSYAKWWVTSQTDVDTVEEEIEGAARLGKLNPGSHKSSGRPGGRESNLHGPYGGKTGEDWLGLTRQYSETYIGQVRGGLRRWTKKHENASYAGEVSEQPKHAGAGPRTNPYLGIKDPGLGEMSGVPVLGDRVNSSFWILYGQRPFLGLTKCLDPVGAAQGGRADHHHHGAGSNWNGLGFQDGDIGGIISPGATAEGGFFPGTILFGGEIIGASAKATLDDSGNITSIAVTDPGATVITDVNDEQIDAPNVTISLPQFYSEFSATAIVSDDPDEIEAAWPDLFKTKAQLQQEVSDGYNDPLAQTFLVDPRSYPEGMFLASVDLCFQNKPKWGSTLPVYVEIRPTNNGFPVAEHYIISKKLHPNEVNVATGVTEGDTVKSFEDPTIKVDSSLVLLPDFNDPNAFTRFTFDYPIYLEGGTEYAIIVRSNDSAYKLWICDSRQDAIVDASSIEKFDDAGYAAPKGTYAKNYGGSFFRSQNGRTWTPSQWQDMMFRINKCVFGGEGTSPTNPQTGTLILEAGRNLTTDFVYDKIKLNMNSILLPSKGTTGISADFSLIKATEVAGNWESLESLGTSALWNENEEIKTHDLPERMKLHSGRDKGQASFRGDFTLSTTNQNISPQIDTRNCYIIPIQNEITGGGLRAENIKVASGGTGYNTTGNKFKVSGGGSTEDAYFTITGTGGGGTSVLDNTADAITMTTSGGTAVTNEALESGAGFHTSKVVDDPVVVTNVAIPGDGNATFEVLSEEGAEGGNSLTRYQTRPVTLAHGMIAKGLKVFLTAQQPFGTSIHVYFKSLAEEDGDDIDQKTWKLLDRVSPDKDYFDEPSYDFKVTGQMVEYEFGTEDVATYTTYAGRTYDDFTTFVIKIVLFADNPAKPPVVKDMRAIAVF